MTTDRLAQLDYYALLGVESDATPEAIRSAFHAFALQYHPDRHPGREAAFLARAAEIYRRGAEAYRVLSDWESRRLYDDGLSRGALRLDPTAESHVRKSGRPPGMTTAVGGAARTFYVAAQKCIRVEDWKGARLKLQLAQRHDPGSLEVSRLLEEVERQLQSSPK